MKEIVYKFDTLGVYYTDDDTKFNDNQLIKLVIEPHSFELTMSGEVIRSSSCDGYIIDAHNNGRVDFYTNEGELIASSPATEKEYSEVRFLWKQNSLTLQFGSTYTYDNYPNCDGEHDRWDIKWYKDYIAVLDIATGTITTEVL